MYLKEGRVRKIWQMENGEREEREGLINNNLVTAFDCMKTSI